MSNNQMVVALSDRPLFLIRLSQTHLTFRLPEIQSLAVLEGINLEVVDYRDESPFCIISVSSAQDAARLVKRAILTKGIYELLASGPTYDVLHTTLKSRIAAEPALLEPYRDCSFKFSIDGYLRKVTAADQAATINSFDYLDLKGPIRLSNPAAEFRLFEEWNSTGQNMLQSHLGRFLCKGSRDECLKYDLKKRRYISTTSMDAELALITANLGLSAPYKFFYDPFAGTGGFLVSAAHFGGTVMGSDIDARSLRGKTPGVDVAANFDQYSLQSQFQDVFISDLTNSPLRTNAGPWLDGILCDPPYGVREGLSVLGLRKGKGPFLDSDGNRLSHERFRDPGYIPPRRPYSLPLLLADILAFSVATIRPEGRLCMWLPTANETGAKLDLPEHPALQMLHVCVQEFGKWSRRLLTYRRRPERDINAADAVAWEKNVAEMRLKEGEGKTADELNAFRKRYFEGFRETGT